MQYCDEKIMAVTTRDQLSLLGGPEPLRYKNDPEGGEREGADNNNTKARQRPGERCATPAT
jgi:hypothetical protein